MRTYKYEVFFYEGESVSVNTNGPYAAIMLASAEQVKAAKNYRAKKVICLELKSEWVVNSDNFLNSTR